MIQLFFAQRTFGSCCPHDRAVSYFTKIKRYGAVYCLPVLTQFGLLSFPTIHRSSSAMDLEQAEAMPQ